MITKTTKPTKLTKATKTKLSKSKKSPLKTNSKTILTKALNKPSNKPTKRVVKAGRKKLPFIKELRMKLGITQAEFCRKTNIGHSKLSKLESGNYNLTILIAARIQKTFNVSGDDLLNAYRTESRELEKRLSQQVS